MEEIIVDIHVKSWAELVEAIKDRKANFEGEEIWYRGQANSKYELVPSLLRKAANGKKEEEIFRLYNKISQRISEKRLSNWETLFDMQHYYIPTRLLDWSENVGISLFFAIKNCRDENDVALYLLDPLALNKYSKKNKIPILPDDDDGMDYIENYINNRPYPPQYPIAVKPNFINDRMVAQRGAFTVHGTDSSSIESLCPDAVSKIIIETSAFAEILEFLDIANINEYTVFPDMSGVANYIRDKLVY